MQAKLEAQVTYGSKLIQKAYDLNKKKLKMVIDLYVKISL